MGTGKSWASAALILFLFAVMTFGGALIQPPHVRQANVSGQFDTARAFARIERILGDERPHSVDTDANERVRERLMDEITALGFTPDTTFGPACRTNRSAVYFPCTHVTNVAFRLGPVPQPDAKDTLMVTTHYDSVPAGPGAADASIGVATLLEIAAVMKDETLTRPLLFMFTDGEEGGLMGAHYFVRDDPRANEVKTMVNFEARGVRGPAFMFETSRPNGRVIPAYAKDVSFPSANSLTSAVYDMIPNSTDVAVYLPLDYEALNFAVVDGLPFYHTPQDNLANLSKRSLQHMGDQGLTSVRTLANDTSLSNEKTYIYADILSRIMVVLPQIVALPILALAALLALVLLWRTEPRTGRFRTLLAPPLALIIAAADMWILQWILKALRVPDYWWAHGWATQGLAAFVAILGAVVVIRLLCPRASASQLSLAGWIWFLIPGFVCAFVLPGAMILFVLPAIALLIAGLLAVPAKRVGPFVYVLAGLFTLALLLPLFSSLGITLGYSNGWVNTVVAGLALLPFYGALKPRALTPRFFDLPLWTALAGTAALFIAALFLPVATKAMPKPLNIITHVNMDTNAAHTAFGRSGKPDFYSWDVSGEAEKRDLPPLFSGIWSVPAPMPDSYKAPFLDEVSREPGPDGTTVITAHIHAEGADRIGIMVPKTTGPLTAKFEGIESSLSGAGSARSHVLLRCAGRSCDGAEVQFTVKNNTADPWILYGEHFETPESAKFYIDRRPEHRVPIQTGDHTVVTRKQVP